MIPGWDRMMAPVGCVPALGFWNETLTVVDCPTVTVAALTFGVTAVKAEPDCPLRVTMDATDASAVGTVRVAVWVAAASGE